MTLSRALVYSTRPPVSVWGTVPLVIKRLAGFLGGVLHALSDLPKEDGTVRFGSVRGFACGHQRLHPSTGYSVSRRRFQRPVAA